MNAPAEAMTDNRIPTHTPRQNEESADSLLQIRDLKKRFLSRAIFSTSCALKVASWFVTKSTSTPLTALTWTSNAAKHCVW